MRIFRKAKQEIWFKRWTGPRHSQPRVYRITSFVPIHSLNCSDLAAPVLLRTTIRYKRKWCIGRIRSRYKGRGLTVVQLMTSRDAAMASARYATFLTVDSKKAPRTLTRRILSGEVSYMSCHSDAAELGVMVLVEP